MIRSLTGTAKGVRNTHTQRRESWKRRMKKEKCSSKDKGKDVMKACSVGCIGCHLCEKNCPKDAVHVIDNVAYIDQEKCVGCGICAQKCPKKIIL